MKSVTECRYINGKKQTKTEREAIQRSVVFLRTKYGCARSFFYVIQNLKLFSKLKENQPFNLTYLADKLTQRSVFGKYDVLNPARGTQLEDVNSQIKVPDWFKVPSWINEESIK